MGLTSCLRGMWEFIVRSTLDLGSHEDEFMRRVAIIDADHAQLEQQRRARAAITTSRLILGHPIPPRSTNLSQRTLASYPQSPPRRTPSFSVRPQAAASSLHSLNAGPRAPKRPVQTGSALPKILPAE